MKKRVLSLLLAFIMLLGMVPAGALEADEGAVEAFFTAVEAVAEVSNDSGYPFTPDDVTAGGPWLKSGNAGEYYSRSTLTLTMTQAAALSFDYVISGPASSGLEVKNGSDTRYTYSSYGGGGAVTGCNGEQSGTAAVRAEAGDRITISYYRGYASHANDCLWLKNFTYSLPDQVTFHANNGTGDTAFQGVFGAGALEENPFSYEGHIFKGWADSREKADAGTVDYADGGEIETSGDADLYAVWAPVYEVVFTLTPEEAEFALYGDEGHTQKLNPAGDAAYAYMLEDGVYHWAASAFGCAGDSGFVTVEGQGITQQVALAVNPAYTVEFSYEDLAGGGEIQKGGLAVSTLDGEQVMEPSVPGGAVYELPVGYAYTYTFQSANYARQTGKIDLTGETEAGSRVIAVPLTAKTAWEGAGDLLEVQPDSSGVYHIAAGAELAWFAQEVNRGILAGASAVLEADLDLGGEQWTPIGLNYGKGFAGVFDGQGHTVTGLSISASAAGNYGLFGYVEQGTVENLTVEGRIDAAGSSASYGTGGIVGQLSGTGGTVLNCVADVAVAGVHNVGGVVGYVTSGYSTADKRIQNCANLGDVSATGNNAGGVVGCVSGQVSVDGCYNRGTVTGGGWRAGGIAAYLSSGYAVVQNGYSTGAVSGRDSCPVIGKKDSGQAENLYYWADLGSDPNAAPRTAGEMKSASFPGELGEAFSQDMAEPVNGGYPILAFQDTTPKYEVVLAVTPAQAAVTLTDGEGAAVTGRKTVQGDEGRWTFRLRDGVYRFEAAAFGKLAELGSLTVAGAGESRTMVLADAPTALVDLQIVYGDGNPGQAVPEIAVTYLGDGRTVDAEESGSYLLPYGKYGYVVRAKGYAKAEGSFAVSAAAGERLSVPVALAVSAGWDGQTQTPAAPNGEGVYEIASGEELAWFAAQVNSGAGKNYNAVLTGDIDLAGCLWTPIGSSSSCYFSGTFDGGGHTVSGLQVESPSGYAGLFGYTKGTGSAHAVVKGVTVQGRITNAAISYGSYAGGVAGYAVYTDLEDCHNEADVTVTNGMNFAGGVAGYLYDGGSVKNCSNTGRVYAPDSDYVGGVLGSASFYTSATPVTSSYNAGAVTGKTKVGGVIGNLGVRASDVYNTGTVVGTEAVGGIAGYQGADISGAYTVGEVSGSKDTGSAFGRVSSTYQRSNIYYLDTLEPDGSAEAKREEELKGLTYTLNGGSDTGAWKTVSALNGGYPVLSWQSGQAGEGGGPLSKAANTRWRTDPGTGLPTGTASWEQVPHADSYTVILWDYWSRETESGAENGLTAVRTVEGVAGTEYDFTDDIAANGAGWYYFTVTPMAAQGSGYTSGRVPQNEEEAWAAIDLLGGNVCYRYYDQLDQPTGLRWMGHTAYWNQVENAAAYLVMVYRLDDGGGADYLAGGMADGAANALDCRNYFAVGGRYVFSVVALSEEYVLTGVGDKNSPESQLSSHGSNGGEAQGIYTADTAPEPGPGEADRTDWVAISDARQWMELANVESRLMDDLVTDQQAVAWGKKYYLTADLDFAGLSAEDQARTKSIGNAANRFTGVLDGNGHSITGLTLSNHDAGLFAYIGSTGRVCDLTIQGANVQFSDNAAVLALNNYGTIHGCAVVNSNITADTGAVLGGLVSRNYGIIRDCCVQGGVLTSNSPAATGHAGFVGANETGGVIESCWTSMDVNTASEYAGGFVGLSYGGTIRDCFALGDVSARSYSGGFAGRSVFPGSRYENCYAAGNVAVSGEEGHGFIGGSRPDSAFQPDLSEEIVNCYYNAAAPADSYAAGRTLAEMRSPEFLLRLGGTGSVWLQDGERNGGLPYLSGLPAPEGLPASSLTVEVALAVYDKSAYAFSQLGETIEVTLESSGNTRVVDVMDAAVAQGLLTYSYDTTPTFGRYIHTINGYAVEAPDGWMFTVNDALSNVSASLAAVEEGDQLLWYEGTTENRFLPPSWNSLAGQTVQWTEIDSAQALLALADSTDQTVLSAHYRLAGDLDLEGIPFPGIGSLEHPFTGTFDGQGHTISNVTVTGRENAGFFNVLKGASVKNLNLSGVCVTGTKNVGGLAGLAQAELDKSDLSKNTACLLGGCRVSGVVCGLQSVGGLVGCNDGQYDAKTQFSISSAIDKCSADVRVTALTADGPLGDSAGKLGGLAGENKGVITKSSASGGVTAPSAPMVGGLVGDSTGDIYDSRAYGDVTGASTVGGFAGYSGGTVKNCCSLGSVTGAGNTGSFAGSLAAGERVVGAGQVTVSDPASSYHGGLAGQLTGQVAGLTSQITVKEAFGNCVQSADAPLNAAGNSFQFQSDAQKAALAQMALTTGEEVSDKLYQLFEENLKGWDTEQLLAERAKYRDTVLVPGNVEIGETISLLREGQTADGDIQVFFQTDSPCLSGGPVLTLAASNPAASTLSIPVVLALTDGEGHTYRSAVTILIQSPQEAREALMDSIAATLTASSDGWTVLDLAAYQRLEGKTHATTRAAWQNALNLSIAEASGEAAVSGRARLELVLRAMGVDSARLYPVNSNTAVDNASRLAAMELTANGYYDAPWLLLAQLQGNLTLSASQTDALIGLLADGVGDGLFGYEWGGVAYTDPDTAGAALAALAPFSGSGRAKETVDAILAALPGALDQRGSLGNANADAMVIVGLIAQGIDPDGVCNSATGASLTDGLLSWVNGMQNGFLYPNWSTGAWEENALATEQGFRALVALSAFHANGGKAFNLYDFSAAPVAPGRATGTGAVDPIPNPDTDRTIQVTFTLKTDAQVWIPRTALTLKEGSTVYHALMQAVNEVGDMSVTGAESGYVTSITKNGVTLAEFEKGERSGWLYRVNGENPNVGLTSYTLSAGDDVLWYYTTDWTKDSGFHGSKQETVWAFRDVTEEYWAAEAIQYVCQAGLMSGTAEGVFSPELSLNRAMLAVILYALEGKPEVSGDSGYTDVAGGAWYADAVAWAGREGIVSGVGEGRFAPNAEITREQMALMLYRYAQYKGRPVEGKSDLSGYGDRERISVWAVEALMWANAQGLINGRTAATLAPQGTATRAETAQILMAFCEKPAK